MRQTKTGFKESKATNLNLQDIFDKVIELKNRIFYEQRNLTGEEIIELDFLQNAFGKFSEKPYWDKTEGEAYLCDRIGELFSIIDWLEDERDFSIIDSFVEVLEEMGHETQIEKIEEYPAFQESISFKAIDSFSGGDVQIQIYGVFELANATEDPVGTRLSRIYFKGNEKRSFTRKQIISQEYGETTNNRELAEYYIDWIFKNLDLVF